MALRRIEGKDEVNLIHHSDRGCQYACREYVGMLRKHGIRVSMTESGDPKDNAQAERINNTMKNELLKGKVFRNINEVVRRSPGRGLLQQPEAAYEHRNEDPVRSVGAAGDRDMMWTSYRHMAIKSRNNLEIPENSLPLKTWSGVSFRPTASSQPLTGITTQSQLI